TQASLDRDPPQPAALQTPPLEPQVAATAVVSVAQNDEPRVNTVAARTFAPVMATDVSAMPQAEVPPAVSSMGREIATVDLARRALREGDATAALQALDDYRARWPSGVFAMEVMVLRVEALLALGERTAAESLAASMIRAQPTSRYSTRLRTMLGSANSSDQKSSSATGKGL
ncbi:MAG TPA: tetratricopeptide repeat protein, partial [Polyangiaceae bacterium]|nr:tetratricopeptide repeat protein [Polyangiaceae bacterium]